MCERNVGQIQTGKYELTFKEGSEVVLGLVEYLENGEISVQYLSLPERDYHCKDLSKINTMSRLGSAVFKKEAGSYVLLFFSEKDNKNGCQCRVEKKQGLTVIKITHNDQAEAILTYGTRIENVFLTMPFQEDFFNCQPTIDFFPLTKPGELIYTAVSVSSSQKHFLNRWQVATKAIVGVAPAGGFKEDLKIQHQLPGLDETLAVSANFEVDDSCLGHTQYQFQRRIKYEGKFQGFAKTGKLFESRVGIKVPFYNPVILIENKSLGSSEAELKKYVELAESLSKSLNRLFFSEIT